MVLDTDFFLRFTLKKILLELTKDSNAVTSNLQLFITPLPQLAPIGMASFCGACGTKDTVESGK
jgi:hypothetical protein